jgi:hypothetical protein
VFAVSMRSLKPGGGVVPLVHLVIQRAFPLHFIERYDDGSRIIRNSLAEEFAQAKFLKNLERFTFMLHEFNSLAPSSRENFLSRLSESDREVLDDIYESSNSGNSRIFNFQEIFQRHNQTSRNVSMIMKLLVSSANSDGIIKCSDFTELTIWDASPDIVAQFSEGKVASVCAPRVSHSPPLSLSLASRNAFFKLSQFSSDAFLRRSFLPTEVMRNLSAGDLFDFSGNLQEFNESMEGSSSMTIAAPGNMGFLFVRFDQNDKQRFWLRHPELNDQIHLYDVRYVAYDARFMTHQAALSVNSTVLVKKSKASTPCIRRSFNSACSISMAGILSFEHHWKVVFSHEKQQTFVDNITFLDGEFRLPIRVELLQIHKTLVNQLMGIQVKLDCDHCRCFTSKR